MKFLVVILVIVLVGWLTIRGRSRPVIRKGRPDSARPAEIVACRHCGVHIPRSEAIEDSTGAYCSEAHRLVGPRPPP